LTFSLIFSQHILELNVGLADTGIATWNAKYSKFLMLATTRP
jgi:hypothetical protein